MCIEGTRYKFKQLNKKQLKNETELITANKEIHTKVEDERALAKYEVKQL